jgi:hypothetical protein
LSYSGTRHLCGTLTQRKKMKMKLLLFINVLLVINGCTQEKSDIWHTHKINPKHLPIEFKENTGENFLIEKGNYVELKKELENSWLVKTTINKKIKTGQIPKNSKTGNPTLVYLEEFDKKNQHGKEFCSTIQLKPQKVLTLRTRPLTDSELNEMITNRSSEISQKINRETAIFGVQHGVKFELVNNGLGKWQKIKIQTKNQNFFGFINKSVKGISTRKNNCK